MEGFILEQNVYDNLKIVWDFMKLDIPLRKADCIVGFGNFNEEIAVRCADLYKQGFADKILFTGGLGRNTDGLWIRPEAERFADVAVAKGVPVCDIIIENKSTNTAENILFTKKIFAEMGLNVTTILGVHQPFMERRIFAALKVYWQEIDAVITSPQLSIHEYIEKSLVHGLPEKALIDVIVGDFQRMDIYAKKGYQIPQVLTPQAVQAFENLIGLGYDGQLIKD